MSRPGRGVNGLVLLGLAGILVLGTAAGAFLWAVNTPGRSYRGAPPGLTAEETGLAERLRGHVATIGSTERNLSRRPDQLEAAARYIEQCLGRLGYEVESQAYDVRGQMTRNLAVMLPPRAGAVSATTIVVGAHYDSFPGSPGANDNATGVAALLELAGRLRDLGGRAPVRLRLVFFTNEEPPYFHTPNMGSFRYAAMLARQSERVAAMYSLETIGFFSDRPGSQRYPFPLGLAYPDRGDFVAFVSMTGSRALMRESIAAFRSSTPVPSEGGVAPGALPGIAWSDHWSFEQFDYPAIMITDTAIFRYPHYHTAEDTPDKIDYDRLARITLGVERMIREKAEKTEPRP